MSPEPHPSTSMTKTAAPVPPGQRGEDVIHNIGYRAYDGPRLGRSYATRSLYSQSLRGSYGLGRSVKSKVLPMLLFVVMCVPAAIMVAVAVATKANDLPVDYTRYAIVMQAPGEPLEIVHDRHTLGVFPEATWRRLLADAGLEVVDTTIENPYAHEQAAFVARRPSA